MITYDPQYNIAYIALRNQTELAEALQVSDECISTLPQPAPG
jgi:uncharacterized protein YuzE